MMIGDAVMLGNAVMLRDVVMFDDVLIAFVDGNMILHFKLISPL